MLRNLLSEPGNLVGHLFQPRGHVHVRARVGTVLRRESDQILLLVEMTDAAARMRRRRRRRSRRGRRLLLEARENIPAIGRALDETHAAVVGVGLSKKRVNNKYGALVCACLHLTLEPLMRARQPGHCKGAQRDAMGNDNHVATKKHKENINTRKRQTVTFRNRTRPRPGCR